MALDENRKSAHRSHGYLWFLNPEIIQYAAHLAGNLTLYGGGEMFNSYAEHLHGFGPLVTLAEWGLLALALVHITTGSILFFQNFMARPQRYHMNKWAGGRTISSATMPYTGFVIVAFVIFHLLNFHFVDKSTTTIYEIVVSARFPGRS